MAHSVSIKSSTAGRSQRGRLTVTNTQKVNGTHARVTAKVASKQRNDTVNFDLYATARGGRQVAVGSLGSVRMQGFEATVEFMIDYGAVQAAIGAAQGANLCINGVWPTGHKWGLGGSRSGGAFRLP